MKNLILLTFFTFSTLLSANSIVVDTFNTNYFAIEKMPEISETTEATVTAVGALLQANIKVPHFEGEIEDEDGNRTLNGVLLNPKQNAVYYNKYCHRAGSYAACRDTNSGSCTWVGGTVGCNY